MINVADTFENSLQDSILAAVIDNVTPRIELVVKLMKASSGRGDASVLVGFKRVGQPGVTTSLESASERTIVFHEFNLTDKTRGYDLDEVGEIQVPRTHYDQQSHIHPTYSILNLYYFPTRVVLSNLN